MAVLEFPPETLVEIFAEVHYLVDLLACTRVCKDFQQVFKDSTRLQYRIELEKAGMINNPYCTLPTPARLKMLREREHAWSHLDWEFITKNIDVPLESSPVHEVASGVAVLGLLDLDMLEVGFGTRGFQSIELPSVAGEDLSTAWKTVDLGENILGLGMAVEEHDLLAYVIQ